MMSVSWEEVRKPAPIQQGRARIIASECPLTWRQVVWSINRVMEEGEWRGSPSSLYHWIETAPLQEVASWVWEQWLHQE